MDIEKFPENEVAKEMLSSVNTGFYNKSYVGKWLFEIMGQEMAVVKKFMEELSEQAFPQSATWGIEYQEEKYGISPNASLSLEERRKQVMIRKSIKAPMNPAFIENQINLLIGYSGTEIEEAIADYTFAIHVSELDQTSVVYQKIAEYVRRVKPSHLAFIIIGSYGAAYTVTIKYEMVLRLISEFYPRNNLQWLLLDGSWLLNGQYVMGQYKIGQFYDSYNSRVLYRSFIPIKGAAGGITRTQSHYIERVQAACIPLIRSEHIYQMNYDESLSMISDVKSESEFQSALRVEKDLWYLDGKENLDGSHKLMAEIIEYPEL